MIRVKMRVENDEVLQEILAVLTNAEEEGEINGAFSIQVLEGDSE